MKRIILFLFLIASLSGSSQILYTFVAKDSNSFVFNSRTYYRNYLVVYYSASNQLNVREIGTGNNLTQPNSPQSYLIGGKFYRNIDSCGQALLNIVTPYGAAGQVLWSDTIGGPIATRAWVENNFTVTTITSRGNNASTYVNVLLHNKTILYLSLDGFNLNNSVTPYDFTFNNTTNTVTFGRAISNRSIIKIGYY